MLANYFFLIGVSFLLGVVSASITTHWFFFALGSLILLKNPRLTLLTFLFFLLGGLYLLWRAPEIPKATLTRLLQQNEIVIEVINESRNRGFYQETIGITTIDKYKTKILLAVPQFYQIEVGDRFALTGQFELLKEKYYLERGIMTKFYVNQLNYLEPHTSLRTILARLKRSLTTKLDRKLSLTASQLVGGLLYGQEITDPHLRQNLKQTGLSHLTAISGYNLTLITSLLFEALKFFPFSAGTISLISTLAIIIFALFVGGQASVIRAALMGVLLIFCKRLGRIPLRRNILLVAALLLTLAEPKALILDLGFQLSFLATFGILYLTEPIQRSIAKEQEKMTKLHQIVAETIAAQIMTLPLIWYKFGQVQLFSFITNAIVLPFIPYLMALGILIIAFLSFPLPTLFSWPYEWFASLIQFFSKMPLIQISIPLAFVMTIYAYLLFWIYQTNRNALPDFSFNFS